jgi:hypothetical protein
MNSAQTRRRFLAALPLGAAALLLRSTPAQALISPHAPKKCGHAHGLGPAFGRGPEDHPSPRVDVDASRVIPAKNLGNPAVESLFDKIREIPEIADGVFCYCGCSVMPGHYSLLSCYEPGGAGQWCEICQGEGALVYRRYKEGQSLEQIRRAIDARFG